MVLQQHSSTQISSGPPPIAPAPGPQHQHITTAHAMQNATPFSGAATQAMTAAHGGVMPQVQLIQQSIGAPYLHQFYNGQGQLIMPAGMLQQAMNPTQMVIATAGGKSYLQAPHQMVAGPGKQVQISGGQPGGGQGPGQQTTGYATGPGGGPGQPQTFVIGQLNPLSVISSQSSLMSAQAQQRAQDLNKALPQGLTWATATPAGFQFSNISNPIFIRNAGPGGHMTAGTVTTNLGGAQVVTASHNHQGSHGMQGHNDGQHHHQQQASHAQSLAGQQQAAAQHHHQQSVIIPGHQFAQAGAQMVTGMLPSGMVPGSPMGMTVSAHPTLVSANQGMSSGPVNQHPPSSAASVVATSSQQQIQPAPSASKAQHHQQHTQTTSHAGGTTTIVGSITPTMPIQPKGIMPVRPIGVQMSCHQQHIQGYPSQIRAMASITPSVGSPSPATIVSGQSNVLISAGDHTKAGNAKPRKPAMSRASASQTPVATKTTTTDSAAGPGPVSMKSSMQHIAPSMAGSPVTSYPSPITVVGVGVGPGQSSFAQSMANAGMVPVSSAAGCVQMASSAHGGGVVWSPLSFPGGGQNVYRSAGPPHTSSTASYVTSTIRTASTSIATGTTVRLPTSVSSGGVMGGGGVHVTSGGTMMSNVRSVGGHPGKLPLPPVTSYAGPMTARAIRGTSASTSTSTSTSTASAIPGMGVRMPRLSGTPPPMPKSALQTSVRSGPGSAPVSVGYAAKPASGAPLGPSSAGSLPSSSGFCSPDVEFVAVSRPSSVPGVTSTSHASTSTSMPSPLSNMAKTMSEGIRRTATPPVREPISEIKAEEPVRSPAVKDSPASPAMATKPDRPADTAPDSAGVANDADPPVPTSVPSVVNGSAAPVIPIPNPTSDLAVEQPSDAKMASPKKMAPSVQSPMKNGLPARVLRQKQPVVKPPVLTHVIDGFVILEGPEPFGEAGGKNGEDMKKGLRNGERGHESGDLKRRGASDVKDEPPKKKLDAGSEAGTHRPARLMSPSSSDASGTKAPGGPGRKNPSQCEVCGKVEIKRRPGRPAARKFCSPACAKKLNAQSKKTSSNESGSGASGSSSSISEEPMAVEQPALGPPAPQVDAMHVVPPAAMEPAAVPEAADAPIPEPIAEVGLFGLPPNIKNWTAEDVSDWLKAIACPEYAKEFLEQEIDGTALLLLKAEHLMQGMNVKLGPALKVCKKIEELQASCNAASAPANLPDPAAAPAPAPAVE